MSTITRTVPTNKGLLAIIQAHPLAAYFFLAYAGAWIVIAPLVMNSMGWINLSEGASFLLFFFSSLSGPALAAYYVTGVLEDKAGMKRLFRRTFQGRAGLRWYLVALFSFLALWLGAYSVFYAGAPLVNLLQNGSLLLSVFLPNVILGLLIPSIGEEPGWRGFALPRLQARYGPILGTVILGTFHGIWHLPAFFTPLLGPITIDGFIAFVLTAIGGTFLYTWVFNNTRSSVWIAMVLHASSNAASNLLGELVPKNTALAASTEAFLTGWMNVFLFGVVALLLVVFTHGKLGYQRLDTQPGSRSEKG
jgi:membrane protease YdiL (CAAX protease family)